MQYHENDKTARAFLVCNHLLDALRPTPRQAQRLAPSRVSLSFQPQSHADRSINRRSTYRTYYGSRHTTRHSSCAIYFSTLSFSLHRSPRARICLSRVSRLCAGRVISTRIATVIAATKVLWTPLPHTQHSPIVPVPRRQSRPGPIQCRHLHCSKRSTVMRWPFSSSCVPLSLSPSLCMR
jgi:hypothetical protein